MTSYIPKLARISAGKSTAAKRPAAQGRRPAPSAVNVEALARLVPQIRRHLAIGRSFSDEALLGSLVAIVRHSTHDARWRAAEASTLGQHLAASAKDRHRALVTLISLLPTP